MKVNIKDLRGKFWQTELCRWLVLSFFSFHVAYGVDLCQLEVRMLEKVTKRPLKRGPIFRDRRSAQGRVGGGLRRDDALDSLDASTEKEKGDQFIIAVMLSHRQGLTVLTVRGGDEPFLHGLYFIDQRPILIIQSGGVGNSPGRLGAELLYLQHPLSQKTRKNL